MTFLITLKIHSHVRNSPPKEMKTFKKQNCEDRDHVQLVHHHILKMIFPSSFDKYLLKLYYVPGLTLGFSSEHSVLRDLTFQWREDRQ